MATGLLTLQRGDASGARELLESGAGVLGGDAPSIAAALALIRTADGDREGAEQAAAAVTSSARATYADRVLALTALGLGAAGRGEVGASRAALGEARQVADGTEDRLAQALVRLAEARASERLGEPSEVGEARATLAGFGLCDMGWDTAYKLAAAGAARETV